MTPIYPPSPSASPSLTSSFRPHNRRLCLIIPLVSLFYSLFSVIWISSIAHTKSPAARLAYVLLLALLNVVIVVVELAVVACTRRATKLADGTLEDGQEDELAQLLVHACDPELGEGEEPDGEDFAHEERDGQEDSDELQRVCVR